MPSDINNTTTISGRMILYKESPEDFSAVNSLFSARFPKVIMEDKSIAKGRANGIKLAETYRSNSKIIETSNPFPMRSSMYFQKNCMINMNMEIINVTINGPMNERILNTYKRFKTRLCS